ncbi:hypothetical protein ACSPAH_06425 [Buttiauxella agrestis]
MTKSQFHQSFSVVSVSAAKVRWRLISGTQRRAILLLPLLACAGAPAMALLPSLVPATFSAREAQSLALALLFARSLGQLVGPLILNPEKFENTATAIC